jgi:hypothetical protein
MGEAAYTLDNVSFDSLITPDPPQVTIDFENVPGLTATTNSGAGGVVPATARLSTQLLGSHGVRFRTEAPGADYVGLVRLGIGHAASGQNGFGGVNANSEMSYTGPTLISFFMPGNSSIPAVTDYFSVTGDRFRGAGETVTLEAYDINNLLLGTTTGIDTGATVFSIARPGMHRIRIRESFGEVALDDLTFNLLQPVPEPSSLLLGCASALSLAVWFLRWRPR